MILNIILIIAVVYLLISNYQIKKTLSSEIFVELAKGNKRLYRGFWKVNPNDYERIALDKRTHEEIAREYGISRSRVGQIKTDYYKKREIEGREIVQNYFKTNTSEIKSDDAKLF